MTKRLLGIAALAAATSMFVAGPALAGCKYKVKLQNISGYDILVTHIGTKVWDNDKHDWKNKKKKKKLKDSFLIKADNKLHEKEFKVARKQRKAVHLRVIYKYSDMKAFNDNASAPNGGERTFYGPGVSCKDSRSNPPVIELH